MLLSEQTKLVLIDNAKLDIDPECPGINRAWLVIGANRDFEIPRLIPIDALFILPPGRVAWTNAAIVWDGKVDVTRVIGGFIVWWGRHSKYLAEMKLKLFV
jgi:hypothetical protein